MDTDRPRWKRRLFTVAGGLFLLAIGGMVFVVRGVGLRAYRIPTGSMQPLIFGAAPPANGDQIFTEHWSYRSREPQRFEVVAFRYPLDTRKVFVSRICGLPGEELRIAGGDLWTRSNADADWSVVRKPAEVQAQLWRSLPDSGAGAGWSELGEGASWQLADGHFTARGAGALRYPAQGHVQPSTTDGYPAAARARIRAVPKRAEIGDLRVEGEVTAAPDCIAVHVELHEADRTYTFELPGPAAADDARPRVSVAGADDEPTVSAPRAWRLTADAPVGFAVQNLDDRLSLELPGMEPLELDVDAVERPEAYVVIRTEGGGAELRDLDVARDILYTGERARTSSWVVPEGRYVMLSDNTLDASDSREWQTARYRWPGVEGGVLRGNLRKHDPEEPNPMQFLEGGERRIAFRDTAGVRHEAAADEVEELDPELAPFVPRELIKGRVFLVRHELPMKPRSQRERIAAAPR